MSRPLRIDYPGAWHHVMNRARKGYELFHDREDYELFLSLLKEASDMFNLSIAAYCLMPNHYHLLVKSYDGNLSRCMRHINGIYTQKYNIRHKSDGTLFRGRYKSVLVQVDSYVLQLVRYIHKNPVKAKLVDHPGDYTWSSHNVYLSKKREWAWLDTSFILSMLTEHKNQQVRKYNLFMGLPVSDEIDSFYSKKNLSSILGDTSFINWVKETFSRDKSNPEIPDSKQLAPDIHQINNVVSSVYGIEIHQLFTAKRGTENEPRNIAIYLARQLRGDRLPDIGKVFNLNRNSSVSSAIERVRKRLEKDTSFQKKINTIKEKVYKG